MSNFSTILIILYIDFLEGLRYDIIIEHLFLICLEGICLDKVILHVDCNKFFASVECAAHPELKDLPLAVSGSRDARHGIILAANQIASGFGVKTAEPIWQAQIKCPELVFVSPNYPLYEEYSRLFKGICAEYSDRIEPFGIDECWIDISNNIGKRRDGALVANEIKERIKKELGLTVSVGVSFNKVFAKLGSDYKKPDAVTIISRDNFKDIVWPLSVDNLLYVGGSTKKKLIGRGVFTIKDLINMGKPSLELLLGKQGATLYDIACGNSFEEVNFYEEKRQVKSISNSTTTTRDLTSLEDIKLILTLISESVAMRLREQNLRCKTVSINLKDSSLRSFSRQTSLKVPTSLSSVITNAAFKLATENLNEPYFIRSVGIAVSDLCSDSEIFQIDLFDEAINNEKQEHLEKTVDILKSRFGVKCIKKASILKDSSLSNLSEDNITSFKTDL